MARPLYFYADKILKYHFIDGESSFRQDSMISLIELLIIACLFMADISRYILSSSFVVKNKKISLFSAMEHQYKSCASYLVIIKKN